MELKQANLLHVEIKAIVLFGLLIWHSGGYKGQKLHLGVDKGPTFHCNNGILFDPTLS